MNFNNDRILIASVISLIFFTIVLTIALQLFLSQTQECQPISNASGKTTGVRQMPVTSNTAVADSAQSTQNVIMPADNVFQNEGRPSQENKEILKSFMSNAKRASEASEETDTSPIAVVSSAAGANDMAVPIAQNMVPANALPTDEEIEKSIRDQNMRNQSEARLMAGRDQRAQNVRNQINGMDQSQLSPDAPDAPVENIANQEPPGDLVEKARSRIYIWK